MTAEKKDAAKESGQTRAAVKLSAFFRWCARLVRLENFYVKNEDLLLYIFFGGLTTLVSLATQFIAADFLGTSPPAVTGATVISNITAITFAYITNKIFVFRSVTETKKAFAREILTFYGARGVSMLLDIGIMHLFFTVLHFNYKLTKIGGQFIILAANYLFSKLIVFRKKDSTAEKSEESSEAKKNP